MSDDFGDAPLRPLERKKAEDGMRGMSSAPFELADAKGSEMSEGNRKPARSTLNSNFRDRQRDGWTDGQTGRWTAKETERYQSLPDINVRYSLDVIAQTKNI